MCGGALGLGSYCSPCNSAKEEELSTPQSIWKVSQWWKIDKVELLVAREKKTHPTSCPTSGAPSASLWYPSDIVDAIDWRLSSGESFI